MEPIRIFLVDDSIGFIYSAEDFLKTFPQVSLVGHEMSARKALVKIPNLHVDVVLLDLVMSEMDGLEFLNSIKDQPSAPKVIILTLFDEPIYRKAAEAALADGFVPKTEFGAQLMPLVFKLMGRGEEINHR